MGKNGIAFVELLIVISIIAILALLTVPVIKANKLDGATRMIYSDLLLARMQAIAKGNNFRVIFNAEDGHTYDNHTYWIHNDKNSNSDIEAGEEFTIKDIHKDYEGVTFTVNNNATFNPRGTSNSGTVTLIDQSGSKYVIFSWTGRVRISDMPP
ncbi:MAG: GspH/FimT family pseudopilin [Nitrospirota bacterium]